MGLLELSKSPLWKEDQVEKHFAEFDDKIVALIGEKLHKETYNSTISKQSADWLKWCKNQTSRVKVIGHNVPAGILPKHIKGCLYDIKVQGKKRSPDDALYNANGDLR